MLEQAGLADSADRRVSEFSTGMRQRLGGSGTSSGSWTTDMLGVWSFAISFPGKVFGRLLALAFMAVLFAGEYQWGTLLFIVPSSRRSSLILTKAAVTTSFVLISFVLSSLIVGIGQTAGHALADLSYGPPLTADSFLSFAGSYLEHVVLGIFSVLILAGFAALASILTCSILGGLLASLGLAVLEPMALVLLVITVRAINRPEIGNLYRFAATYHLDNARSWFVNDQPLPPPLPGFNAEPALAVSLIVLVLWVAGLIGLSIVLFNRQDITS